MKRLYRGWNHRVIRQPDAFLGVIYAVHEVYYDAETGAPRSCTAEPVAPIGETAEELKSEMAMFRRAFKLPILDMKDFRFTAEKGKRNLPAIPQKSRTKDTRTTAMLPRRLA